MNLFLVRLACLTAFGSPQVLQYKLFYHLLRCEAIVKVSIIPYSVYSEGHNPLPRTAEHVSRTTKEGCLFGEWIHLFTAINTLCLSLTENNGFLLYENVLGLENNMAFTGFILSSVYCSCFGQWSSENSSYGV